MKGKNIKDGWEGSNVEAKDGGDAKSGSETQRGHARNELQPAGCGVVGGSKPEG